MIKWQKNIIHCGQKHLVWNVFFSLEFRDFHFTNSLPRRKDFKTGNYLWIWWRNRYEVARVQIKVSASWKFHKTICDLGHSMKSNCHQVSTFANIRLIVNCLQSRFNLRGTEFRLPFTCLSGNLKKQSQWTTRNISWQKPLCSVYSALWHCTLFDTCLSVS